MIGQQNGGIAIGSFAGSANQRLFGIAIGSEAGSFNKGINNAIAIGQKAGYDAQKSGSIVLNASGAEVNTPTANAFYVRPVRSKTETIGSTSPLVYNPITYEICYDASLTGFTGPTGQTGATGEAGTLTGSTGTVLPNGTALGQALRWDTTTGRWQIIGDPLALGSNAGLTDQSIGSVALGLEAGKESQRAYAVAVGSNAGILNQGGSAVAIGQTAKFPMTTRENNQKRTTNLGKK